MNAFPDPMTTQGIYKATSGTSLQHATGRRPHPTPQPFLRNIKLITLCTSLSAGIAAIYGFIRPDTYMAEATILVERGTPSATIPESLYSAFFPRSGSASYVDQHISLLRSREIMAASQKLVSCPAATVDPGNSPAALISFFHESASIAAVTSQTDATEPGGAGPGISALQVPKSPFEPSPDSIDIRISSKSYRSELPKDTRAATAEAKPLQPGDIGPSPSADPGDTCTLRDTAPVSGPQPERLSVSEAPKGSSVLRLTYTGASSAEATAALQAIMDAYLQHTAGMLRFRAVGDIGNIDNHLSYLRQQILAADPHQGDVGEAADHLMTGPLPPDDSARSVTGGLSAGAPHSWVPGTTAPAPDAAPAPSGGATGKEFKARALRAADLLTRDQEIRHSRYAELMQLRAQLAVVATSGATNVRVLDTAWSDGQPVNVSSAMLALIVALSGLIGSTGVTLALSQLRTGYAIAGDPAA